MMRSYEDYIKEEKQQRAGTKANLRVALKAANMGAWNYDAKKEKLYASDKHQELLGLAKGENPSTSKVLDVVVEEDKERVDNAIRQVLKKGGMYEVEYRIKKNGEIRWIRSVGTPIKRLGKVVHVSGVIHDITSEKVEKQELQMDQRRLQHVFDSLPVFINVIDENMKVKDINEFMTERLGYEREDLVSENIMKRMAANSEGLDHALEHISKADGSWKDFDIRTKDGEILNTSWTTIKLGDDTYLGIGVDITERSRLEKAVRKNEERLALAVNSGQIGLWDWNVKDDELVISDEWAEQLGYSKEELEPIDFNTWKTLTHPVDYEKSIHLLNKHFAGELDFYENEIRMKHKNGRWLWKLDRGEVVERDENGDPIRVIGAHVDITERKYLEDEIKENRERLEVATNSANLGLWEWHPQTGELYCNEKWAGLIGYTLEELEPVNEKTWENFLHPEDLKTFKEQVDIYFRGELQAYELEVRMRHKDGHWVWVLTRGRVVERNDNGEVIRMAGTHIDITDRKRLEQNIEKSRERLEVATNSANVGLWEWYPQSGETEFDENWTKLIGYDLEELEPVSIETWNRFVHPDDLEKFHQKIDDYFAGKTEIYECEVRMRHKDGHWVWILDRGKVVEWDDEGNPYRMAGTHIDISDQKESERLLRESQRVANLGTYVLDIETHEARTSRILDKMFGMPEGEGITLAFWEELLHPDFKFVATEYELAMENGKPFEAEYKIIRKSDGQERWVYEKADVEKDEQGSALRMLGIMQDITTIKEFEIELEKEKSRFKITSNLVSDVVWDYFIEEGSLWWSEGIHKHFGFTKGEIPNGIEFWTDHIHPDDLERVVTSFQNAIDGNETVWSEEYRFLAANGDERLVLDRGYIFRNYDKKAMRMTGAILDLTDQKKSEELLQYQADLLESISDAVISGDEKFRVKSWNQAAESIYGYTKEEIIGGEIRDILHTDYLDADAESVRRSLLENGEWQGEVVQYRKDGSPVYILSSVRARFDEEGEFKGTVAVNRDITEIKKAQDRLANEQKRFEYASSVVSDVIWDYDAKADTLWWSDGFKTNFGYDIPPLDEGGSAWRKRIHPEDREWVIEGMEAAEKGDAENWSAEYRFYRADGTIAHVLDQSYIMRDEEGEIIRIIGAMNDITSERIAEKELRKSEEHYRLLFEQSPIPMWIFNPETYRFESANESAIQKYGYTEEEFKEMVIFDLHPESDQEAIRTEAETNLQKHQTEFDEWTHITKTGEKLIAEISGTFIYFGENRKRLLIANDITQQRMAEKQAISAVVEGEERERARVAQELHDGLGQYLSAAKMNLNTVYEDLDNLDEKLEKPFKAGLSMLHHAIEESRSISQNLLPKSIQDYGLKLAVAALVNDMQSAHKQIDIQLYQSFDDAKLSQSVQVNLFRIVQESLHNAMTHGKPAEINLQLILSNGDLIYTIEDNGSGFDPKNLENRGLGLQSMKTRVAAMAGNIDIESDAGKGTLITVVVPLKD